MQLKSLSILILAVGLCGCVVQRPPAAPSPARAMLVSTTAARPQPAIAPTWPTLQLYWNPGGYADFVIVASADVTVPRFQWPPIGETTETNFPIVADQPQQFFTLYGTNADTGESAWVQ